MLLGEVVIDAPRETFDASRRFWVGALAAADHGVEAHPEFVALEDPAALCVVGLQELEDAPTRLHLDIEASDVEAEVRRLEGFGAAIVERVRTWVVMRDVRFAVLRGGTRVRGFLVATT